MEKWESSEMIAQGMWIILLFVFILVFSIILLVRENFQRISKGKLKDEKTRLEHQQKLLETNIMVQEQERTRIAADIHDILIGKLTIVKIKNEIAYEQEEIDSLIKEIIAVSRKISHDLSLPMLTYTDLEQLIAEIIAQWRTVFDIEFVVDRRSESFFSDTVKIHLTRILQELIMNIVKHAQATSIKIYMRHTENWLLISVKDDGRGFDTLKESKGLGLKNIEFRVSYIRGSYKYKSEIGKGTSYLFIIHKSEFASK